MLDGLLAFGELHANRALTPESGQQPAFVGFVVVVLVVVVVVIVFETDTA